MRRFYLTKNKYGFYSVRLVNQETGKTLSARSTNNERALSHKVLAIRMQEKRFKRGLSYGVRFWLGLAVMPE